MKEGKFSATIRRRRQTTEDSAMPLSRPLFVSIHRHVTNALASHDGERQLTIGTEVFRRIVNNENALFATLIAMRALSSLLLQTSFVPDEYWQSVEVAHRLTFNYGYLTWEWQENLRSYLYPAVFAAAYRVVAFLRLDHRVVLIRLPCIIQALAAGYADFRLFKLSKQLSGPAVAKWTICCCVISWFHGYCATRTLTNSMETVLTTIALSYYPWPTQDARDKPSRSSPPWFYMIFVALALAVRCTAVIQFIPLVLYQSYHLARISSVGRWFFRHVQLGVVFVGISYLSALLDRLCAGHMYFAPWNFLKFNVFSGQSGFYGTHPWHWYLSQGIPVMLASHLIPFLVGVSLRQQPILLLTCAWTTLVYSLLGHKEFRFLYPLMPIAFHYCGLGLNTIWQYGRQRALVRLNEEPRTRKERADKEVAVAATPNMLGRYLLIVLLITNLPLFLYMSLVHQRGVLDVMRFLADRTKTSQDSDVMFLMPCHSTPYYGYLHKNVTMNFLTCEPNLSHTENYVDEADVFYSSPLNWLADRYMDTTKLPDTFVLFSSLQPILALFLESHRFTECGRYFHTHFASSRVSTHVLVFCRSGS